MLGGALYDTRARDGNEGVETFVEHCDNSILLIEDWQTVDHHKAYIKWRVETGLGKLIGPFMSGPPIARYFYINTAWGQWFSMCRYMFRKNNI